MKRNLIALAVSASLALTSTIAQALIEDEITFPTVNVTGSYFTSAGGTWGTMGF